MRALVISPDLRDRPREPLDSDLAEVSVSNGRTSGPIRAAQTALSEPSFEKASEDRPR